MQKRNRSVQVVRKDQNALVVLLLDEDELHFFVDEFGLERLHGLSTWALGSAWLTRLESR